MELEHRSEPEKTRIVLTDEEILRIQIGLEEIQIKLDGEVDNFANRRLTNQQRKGNADLLKRISEKK